MIWFYCHVFFFCGGKSELLSSDWNIVQYMIYGTPQYFLKQQKAACGQVTLCLSMHSVKNVNNGSEWRPKSILLQILRNILILISRSYYWFRIILPWVLWRTVSLLNVLFAVWPECYPKAFKSRLSEDVRKEDTACYVWKKIWSQGQKVVVFIQRELILHLTLLWLVSYYKKDLKEDKEDSVHTRVRACIPQVLCEFTFLHLWGWADKLRSSAWSFSALHREHADLPRFTFVFPTTVGRSWEKWFNCNEFPRKSLDFQVKRRPQSGAPPHWKEPSEVVQHVQSDSGLSCLEILPDNSVGKSTSTHCKVF